MTIEFYEQELENKNAKISKLKDEISALEAKLFASRAENKELRRTIEDENRQIVPMRIKIKDAIAELETVGFINGQGSKQRALSILKELV